MSTASSSARPASYMASVDALNVLCDARMPAQVHHACMHAIMMTTLALECRPAQQQDCVPCDIMLQWELRAVVARTFSIPAPAVHTNFRWARRVLSHRSHSKGLFSLEAGGHAH